MMIDDELMWVSEEPSDVPPSSSDVLWIGLGAAIFFGVMGYFTWNLGKKVPARRLK